MLSTNLPVQGTWNTPSPEFPVPKATLDVGACVLTASFQSLPRGFPDCRATELMLPGRAAGNPGKVGRCVKGGKAEQEV